MTDARRTEAPDDELDAVTASRMTGYGPQPLDLLASHGHIPGARKMARGWVFRRGDLETFARSNGSARGMIHWTCGYVELP